LAMSHRNFARDSVSIASKQSARTHSAVRSSQADSSSPHNGASDPQRGCNKAAVRGSHFTSRS
jgi:hypothetical protein